MPFRYLTRRRQLFQAYYEGIGRAYVIYPATFLVASAGGLFGLGMVFYLRETLHATRGQVGYITALGSLTYVLGCLTLRLRLQRVLPRYLILAACLLSFTFTGAMQLAKTPTVMYFLIAGNALSLSLFWPSAMCWLYADNEGRDLSRLASWFSVSWSLGSIISPPIAGYLSEKSPRLPLLAGSGVLLAASIFVLGAILALPGVRRDDPGVPGNGANGNKAEPGRQTRLRYAAWVGLFCLYFGAAVLFQIFPMSGVEDLGFAKRLVGTLFLVRAVSTTLGFVGLGRRLFWHFRRVPMLAVSLATAGVFIGMIYAQSPVAIALLLTVFGLTLALSYLSSAFHGASGSTDRGARMALHEAILNGGAVLGASVGGAVYHAYSIAHVYGLTVLVLLACAVAQAGIGLWAKRRDAAETAAC